MPPQQKSVGYDREPNTPRSTTYALQPVPRGGKPFILEVTDMFEDVTDWMNAPVVVFGQKVAQVQKMSKSVNVDEICTNLLNVWAGGMVDVPVGASPGIMLIQGWSPKLEDKEFRQLAAKAKVDRTDDGRALLHGAALVKALREFYSQVNGRLDVKDIQPTEEELETLMTRQTAYAEYRFAEAERLAQEKLVKAITPEMRVLASWLGRDRVWGNSGTSTGMVPCPLCTKQISNAAIVCPECGHKVKAMPAALAALNADPIQGKTPQPVG